MTITRYQVQIINPANGSVKVWSSHDNRPAAELEAGKVRRVGMWAQVRRVEEPPEHGNRRRAFLVWALMLGAIKPERVVERIVAEVEATEGGA